MTSKRDQIITRVGSEEIRKALKKRAIDDGTTVQALVEGWITEYVAGGRSTPSAPPLDKAKCPQCEALLQVLPDRLKLLEVGPIEPLGPGDIPEELVPLAKLTMQYYASEPVFARILNGIIAEYRREKK